MSKYITGGKVVLPSDDFTDTVNQYHLESEADNKAKIWFKNCQDAIRAAMEADAAELAAFGPCPYIATIKTLLNKYDPSVSYQRKNEGVCRQGQVLSICPNRKGFLAYFHSQTGIDGDGNIKAKQNTFGRATQYENGRLDVQFSKYRVLRTTKDEEPIRLPGFESHPVPPYTDYGDGRTIKPDFLSPIPPYVSMSGKLPFGSADDTLTARPDLLGFEGINQKTSEYNDVNLTNLELAHIVDSGQWAWVQTLVNYHETGINPKTVTRMLQKSPITVFKKYLDRMHSVHRFIWVKQNLKKKVTLGGESVYFDDVVNSEMYFTDDKTNWDDPSSISLGTVDSAANILMINHRAHYLLYDNWMKYGSPNMSQPKQHSFFTVDATGKIHGYAKTREFNSRVEFLGPVEKGKSYLRTRVGPGFQLNKWWFDTSDNMKEKYPYQWLQNYRRKRWTQIRNIFYGFMLEVSYDVDCASIHEGIPRTFPDQLPPYSKDYDEEYSEYLDWKSDTGQSSIAAFLGAPTKKRKDDEKVTLPQKVRKQAGGPKKVDSDDEVFWLKTVPAKLSAYFSGLRF